MPSEAELLSLIRERPDDLELRRVFGDWMQEAGDPRGELVSLQVRAQLGTNDYQKRKFARAAQAELERSPGALFGPAQDDKLFTVEWFCGFIHVLANRLQRRVVDGRALTQKLGPALDHPSSRLLRKLHLRASSAVSSDKLAAAIRGHVPDTLEELGMFAGEYTRTASEALYAAAPNIRSLQCITQHQDFGHIHLPELRELSQTFSVPGSGVTDEHLKSFRAAWWPKLETIRINSFAASEDALRDFFSPNVLPKLRTLTVGWRGMHQLVQPDILHWPILGQLDELEILDLSIGAKPLIAASAAFAPTTRIKFPEVSDEERAQLTQAFGSRLEFVPQPTG